MLSPMHTPAQTHYQAELDAGRFTIQRCSACRGHVFPPRELCPHCGVSALEWVTPAGAGTVYSSSSIARRPQDGGSYNVALIDLDEGARMMSRVEGVAPDAVAIGLRVQAQVVRHANHGLVVFHPIDAGAHA